MALVNLNPKANYLSIREQQRKKYRHYESGMTRKEKEEWGTMSDFSTRFDDLFSPTEFVGVYMSIFDEDVINIWCKQHSFYGNRGHNGRYSRQRCI